MKEHFCPVEQSVITYQGKCNWCGEIEGGTITFHNSNADWVMRITADRRIEVNEDVEVTEAAQKVLDAMQPLLKAQRTWVDLTAEQMLECNMDGDWTTDRETAKLNVQAKLKELNT
jgi:polyphosphate kinase